MGKLSIEEMVLYGVSDPAEKVYGIGDAGETSGVLGGDLDSTNHLLRLDFVPFTAKECGEPEDSFTNGEATTVRFVELDYVIGLLEDGRPRNEVAQILRDLRDGNDIDVSL